MHDLSIVYQYCPQFIVVPICLAYAFVTHIFDMILFINLVYYLFFCFSNYQI